MRLLTPPELGRVRLVFLCTRRASTVAILTLAVLVAIAVAGSFAVTLPSSSQRSLPVEYWRLLAIIPGTAPVLLLSSSLASLESACSDPFYRFQGRVLGAAFITSLVLTGTAVAMIGDKSAILQTSRALLAWFGLALASGRAFGWRLSWILPWTTLFGLLYWGYDTDQASYRWWEFMSRPPSDWVSLVLSAVLFVLGTVAYLCTPWRVSTFRRRLGAFIGRTRTNP